MLQDLQCKEETKLVPARILAAPQNPNKTTMPECHELTPADSSQTGKTQTNSMHYLAHLLAHYCLWIYAVYIQENNNDNNEKLSRKPHVVTKQPQKKVWLCELVGNKLFTVNALIFWKLCTNTHKPYQ